MILRNLNYVQCLIIAPMEKAWFVVPVEYNPNGKGKMSPMGYTPMAYSPKVNGMVLWKIVFEVVIIMLKNKKAILNVNKN